MVIQRELAGRARRPITYWGRFVVASIGVIVAFQGVAVLESGRDLFFATAVVGIAFCILEALWQAAASLAEERSQGSLGLLLLTPLTGPELLFGKLCSALACSLPLALALLPIVGITVLLGGVSAGEFLRSALALAHILCLVIVVGMIVSADSKSAMGAAVGTILCLGCAFIFFGVVSQSDGLRRFNPLTPLTQIEDFEYQRAPSEFWTSLLTSQAVALFLLWFYSRGFPRRWRTTQSWDVAYSYHIPPPAPSRPAYGKIANRVQTRDLRGTPRWFDGNPFEWLTLREVAMHNARMPFALMAAAAGAGWLLSEVAIIFAIVFSIGLVLLLCIASTRSFAVARSTHSFEFIVTTPLGAEGILKGHLSALRKLFFWPSLITLVSFVGWVTAEYRGRLLFYREAPALAYVTLGFAMLLLATPWIGMWMGLRCKSTFGAIAATLFLVLLLPRFGGFCAIDAIYFALLGGFARHRVHVLLWRMLNMRRPEVASE